MRPRTVVISAGGTVDFGIGPFHRPAIYEPGTTPEDAARLHDRLIDEHAIEVPVFALDGSLWVRVSAQVYNQIGDYARLAEALGG